MHFNKVNALEQRNTKVIKYVLTWNNYIYSKLEIKDIVNKENCIQRKLINDQIDITHHM